MKVTQVSAGMYHSCALTASGQLYTWGNNSKGQLGLGRNSDMVFSPSLVESLTGVPVAGVTCGGNHTLVVTRSGAVYAWGSNNHGQLGLGDTKDRMWPTQVSTLRNLRVLPAGVVAGLEHTVALTSDGGVFTWGSGRCGQLGHGSFNSETQPRKVMELMGTSVSQVAAGDRHTLAYIPSRAKLYAMGVGGSGQLGRVGGGGCSARLRRSAARGVLASAVRGSRFLRQRERQGSAAESNGPGRQPFPARGLQQHAQDARRSVCSRWRTPRRCSGSSRPRRYTASARRSSGRRRSA